VKIKILIAFILLIIGLIYVTDWIVFSIQEENERMSWEDFKLKYIKRFPDFFQPMVRDAVLFTFIFMTCFAIAGLIFIRDFINDNKKVYFILGIFSFVMAGWQIFSLM